MDGGEESWVERERDNGPLLLPPFWTNSVIGEQDGGTNGEESGDEKVHGAAGPGHVWPTAIRKR